MALRIVLQDDDQVGGCRGCLPHLNITCPRCETEFTTGRPGGHCPSCGVQISVPSSQLDAFEEDPDFRPFIWDLD